MSLNRAYGIVSAAWNSNTWDDDPGGVLDWDYTHQGNSVADRVADQIYPSAILFPEKDCMVELAMREPVTTLSPGGGPSDLVLTLVTNEGTFAITFKNLVFLGSRGGGVKSTPAQCTLMFQYQGDGSSIITTA